MNIEKIKNYNQKMLALICTLGVILLFLFILMLIIEMFPFRSFRNQPQGLIADEKVEILNQGNLRKQIISYEMPWLIDTLNSIYIIPVSLQTLKKPEEIIAEEEVANDNLNLFSSSYKTGKGYYGKKYFEGKYSNLIIYNPLDGKTIPLFDERVIIGNVNSYYFNDDILLIFYTASKDTDKNGVIDLNDLKNINIYSLNAASLRRISDGENHVMQYQFIENSKNLLIKYKLNQYKDNQFSSHQAPTKIMKYEYDSEKLSDIVPEGIEINMQKLIEGKTE